MSSAVFGLVGVLLGSLSTSLLTIYRERLTTRREQAARDEQYERDRNTHATFSSETAFWPFRVRSQT
jgi:hypothetical protein